MRATWKLGRIASTPTSNVFHGACLGHVATLGATSMRRRTEVVPRSDIGYFAVRLRMLRTAAGLTRLDLADRMGVAPTTVRRWESGVGTPSLETLGRLSAVIGVPPAELLPPSPSATAADAWDLRAGLLLSR